MKKNASFDFIFENRLFTGSDSYTLTITFPLSGCVQNIDIFGHIHRADVVKSKVVFDCDIRDGAFFRSGSITITEISDVEVKTQFLEGRSEQNFDESFDDIFLNEMDLGYPSQRKASNVPVMAALKPYPVNNFVPLPWVNNFSGNIQNGITTVLHGYTGWEKPSATLTFQPYLIYIKAYLHTVGLYLRFQGSGRKHIPIPPDLQHASCIMECLELCHRAPSLVVDGVLRAARKLPFRGVRHQP